MSSADIEPSLTTRQRRHARRLLYRNGAIWAVGNGLISTMLVVYLAMELETGGLALGVSFLLAAPNLIGVLRLTAPAMIGRLADRKRFCIGAFVAAALVLLAVPWVAVPGLLPSDKVALVALVMLWCVYHLLQYLATVALWSWLADLVPPAIRGRFLGRRERWMVAGQAGAMLAAALFAWGWKGILPDLPPWLGHAIPAVLGAGFMLAAVVPLVKIPQATVGRVARSGATLASVLTPFRDGQFWRLVFFGCWLSFFNGVTQSAQYTYPGQVLGVALSTMLVLRTMTRIGEFTISPSMGRLADRWGNRPVIFVSLLVAAQGPLFYFLATPEDWWWLAAAWLAWIAYAGVNVALPNLMLALSPRQSNGPYIAMYYAVTGLCYAASTIVGGVLADRCHEMTLSLGGGRELDYYSAIFLFGWITRMLGVVVLLSVIEGPRRRPPR
jgi:MFS family permease